MSDFFGIEAGVHGAVGTYFRSARRTGRTTNLVESVRDGDRIVFTDEREARRVEKLIKRRGVKVECVVLDPRSPTYLAQRGPPQGRLILDHSWIERFYLGALEATSKEIDFLQREFGGEGHAHEQTRLAAREVDKWWGEWNTERDGT